MVGTRGGGRRCPRWGAAGLQADAMGRCNDFPFLGIFPLHISDWWWMLDGCAPLELSTPKILHDSCFQEFSKRCDLDVLSLIYDDGDG
jgi:hypothetical protein